MKNTLTQAFVGMSKTVIIVIFTAVTVVAIQGYADNHTVLEVEPLGAASSPVDANAAQTWAPSQGFAQLIKQVSPAVVHVATSGYVERQRNRSFREFGLPPGFDEFFPYFRDRPFDDRDQGDDDGQNEREKRTRPLGIGSGFVISADGYVVTNHHVINRADEIVVTMSDGKEYTAEIKGSDPKTDLALLKINNARDLPYVVWGDDTDSEVGDWVVAIGNPFGLGGSSSAGIISAFGRDIQSGPYDDYIQVDAAINRGNSGGPLFNTQGQVIGINTAIYSPNGGSVGIGFSIPASMAQGIIRQLRDAGEVERAWIGVGIQAISKDLAESLGRDDDAGALITSVEEGAPASRSELQVGDIILEFDGKAINEMRDLPRIVASSKVGDRYDLKIWRDGDEQTISISTDRFPEDEQVADSQSNQQQPDSDEDVLGAQMTALTSELRSRYNIGVQVNGVLLQRVLRDGFAAENGLRRGDVISLIDGQSVTSAEQVNEVVAAAIEAGRSSVSMLLVRSNAPRFVPFNLR